MRPSAVRSEPCSHLWCPTGARLVRRHSCDEQCDGLAIERCIGKPVIGDGRPAVGTHRLHRLRRPTDAHLAPAGAVREQAGVALGERVRGRDRCVQPVTRTGIDATRHLLCVAGGRRGRRVGRWHRHSSFPGSSSSWVSRVCSSLRHRRPGCSEQPREPERPSPQSRSAREWVSCPQVGDGSRSPTGDGSRTP